MLAISLKVVRMMLDRRRCLRIPTWQARGVAMFTPRLLGSKMHRAPLDAAYNTERSEKEMHEEIQATVYFPYENDGLE